MKTYSRFIAALVGALALYGVVSPAHADGPRTRTFIPFEFTAGRTTLPAGTYVATRTDGPASVIQLRSPGRGVFLASHEEKAGDAVRPARMVFHRYGNRYFLREIWFSDVSGYPLPESSAERQVIETHAKVASRITVASGAAR
jgi:hypothetical protein